MTQHRPAPQPVDGPAVAIIVAIAVLLAVLAGLYVANVIRPAPAPTGDDTAAVAALNAPRQGDPLCRRFTRSHAGDTVPARRASVHCHATTTRRGTV